ncbi:GNAT family N-acetyltransferase [Candidatus Dojkabacteria bacterium]|nr:GNAT family N-acetyltransferase [Candidatus Dojkabacteria bacterium]
MNLTRLEARKVIRFNNLLWRCSFYDELLTLPCYEMCFVLNTDAKFMNCAMNFDLDSKEELLNEIPNIEGYFKKRRKPSSIYLSGFDAPEKIENEISTLGYKEIKDEEAIFWGLEYGSLKNRDLNVEGLDIKECRTEDEFAEYLIAASLGYSDFDYTPYASSLSKLFKTHIDGVTQLHFAGYVDDKPVASGSMGICFDTAIWINAAVVPEYRRKGINTRMMLHAITEANKLGADKFYFCTDVDNYGSIGSGKKLGFEEVIRQKMFSKEG